MSKALLQRVQQKSGLHATPSFTPVRSGLLQRKCACGGTPGPTGECKACKKKRLGLQTKLAINQPGDIYEQEADQIADQVTATPAHHVVSSALSRIQRFAGQPVSQMEAAPASVDQALASHGRPLERELCQDMEQRFGHDFSRVRVHADAAAAQSAGELHAKAYTAGRHVVFAAGKFAPASREGKRLLAHELTHVVQQSGTGEAAGSVQPSRILRKPDEGHYPTVEEQKKIEKLLGRAYKTTRTVTTETGEQVEEKGRHLTADQIKELADRLEEPFAKALDVLDIDSTSAGNVLDESGAREAVEDARKAVMDHFGKYTNRPLKLTFDPKISEEDRKKAGQVLVVLGDPDAAYALAATIVEGACEKCRAEIEDLDEASKRAVKAVVIIAGFRTHEEQLRRVAKNRVPGKHGEEGKITLRLTERATLYPTAVHELIHQLAHPAFHAAFLAKHRNIVEGFTEYFTREIVSHDPKVVGPYDKFAQAVSDVRDVIKGPFTFSSIGGSAEESLRQAYFRGRLELIGWTAADPDEKKAVVAAHEAEGEKDRPAEWSAATAKQKDIEYVKEAQEQQSASKNVLSVGLFFTKKSPDTIALRYARVLWSSDPYAKHQLYVEGQVLASQSRDPKLLGASLGAGIEYEEPYFYAAAGVRFVGTDLPGTGTNRLDVSPFAGLGLRPWQTVRLGVEGIGLIPTRQGQEKGYGVGASVGVEF